MRKVTARTTTAVIGVALCIGVGATAAQAQSVPASSGPGASPATLRIVGLGDSIMTAHGCDGCALYLDQYAAGLSQPLGPEVVAQNLGLPGAEVAQTLQQVRESPTVRDAVAHADGVVITIGINDLPFNRRDDPCGVAPQYPVIDWAGVTHECTDLVVAEYGRDLDAVLSEIQSLRADAPTLVRVTTVYDSVIGDTVDPGWDAPEAIEPAVYAVDGFYRAACDAAAAHGARCVDTYHALNGATGRDPAGPFLAADSTHLAQAGHDTFAEVLLAAGAAPLR